MNRKELIDAIAEDTEASKASTARFVDSFVSIIQKQVAHGEPIKITGFGTFERSAVAAKLGRNPKTGVPIKIPSTFKPKFTPGSTFKEIVKE